MECEEAQDVDDEDPKDDIPEDVTFEEPKDEENEVPESKDDVPKKESTQDKINFVVSLLESSEEISDDRLATLRMEERYFRMLAEEEQQQLLQ